ncbi:hypothetical protein [Hydrogenophaga sp.]|uniref:hypothetical protein n=1 Tax=Hydrogenophaga sp. TaxID=1904254 RepID=UPI0027223601|nr:hypothetical protein [Hydrogenophaga sp.]MDO8904973.1 hypothetical protein [Hydrogenophaga sp.]
MNHTLFFARSFSRAALLVVVPALLWGCAAAGSAPPYSGPDNVMCTMDVIQCSNGDWVGRKPPGCQFACPAGSQPLVPPR